MRLIDLLLGVRMARIIDRRGAEIAQRSLSLVWERVAQRAPGMRPAEARGYVRARAAEVIADETDEILLRDAPRVQTLRAEIIRAANAKVVERIVRELLKSPARPAARRAA